jgi:hypothetical protein
MSEALDDLCEGAGLETLGLRVSHDVGGRIRFVEDETIEYGLWRRWNTERVLDVGLRWRWGVASRRFLPPGSRFGFLRWGRGHVHTHSHTRSIRWIIPVLLVLRVEGGL